MKALIMRHLDFPTATVTESCKNNYSAIYTSSIKVKILLVRILPHWVDYLVS